MESEPAIIQSKKQAIFMDWFVDILIYNVVLNIFIHYVDDFYSESFLVSFATTVVLKAMLVIILRFEHVISDWFEHKKGQLFKILKPITLWIVLFGSKFVILEVLDIIFGHKIDLHNIIMLILMIIVMIASREAINAIYKSLGDEKK